MITRLTFGGVGVGSVCCVAEVQAAEAKDNAALKGSSTPWLIGGAAFILTTAAGYFLLREQDDKKKKPFVIGVTGGIATGKSTVIRHLSSMGATVLDADKLGHNAYEKGTTCFDQVVAAFGQEVVGEDGEVNRKVLAPIVFGDPSQMERLNSIVWPVIRAKIEAEVAKCGDAGKDVVVVEAAVLLEAKWNDMVQSLWVVCVEPETAVQRIMKRNNLPEKEARKRVNFQMGNQERLALAGPDAHVIWNNGSLEEYKANIHAEYTETMKIKQGETR